MNRCLALVCALVLASLTVSSACLADPINQGTRLVWYDDLDLSTARGVAALNRRVDRALNVVCFDPFYPSPAGSVDPDCARDGRRAARAQIAIAIARHKLGNPAPETQVSSNVDEPKPVQKFDH